MERLNKHVSEKTNSRNDRRALFSVQSVPRGYDKAKEDCLIQSSFEAPASQDMNLGAEELELRESLEMAVEGDGKRGIRL
jgi:hypothetical protein